MGERDDPGRRLDARFADWDARLDRLDRLDRLEPQERPAVEIETSPAQPAPGRHILFVPSPSGYELVEGDGTVPSPGETVKLPGRDGRYAVTKVVRSPLPDDRRTCAYLQLT